MYLAGSRLTGVGGVLGPSPSVIIGDGDSIMDSGGVSIWSDTFPGQLSVLRGMGYSQQNSVIVAGNPASYIVNNWGIGGQYMDNMEANAATNIDPLFLTHAYLMALGGTNDFALGGHLESEVYQDTVAYCQARQAVGFKVGIFTMLSRGDVNIDTQRNAYNADVRANWPTFADYLLDIAADATMGPDGAWSNTTYFNADTIHPIAAGYAIFAALVHATFPA